MSYPTGEGVHILRKAVRVIEIKSRRVDNEDELRGYWGAIEAIRLLACTLDPNLLKDLVKDLEGARTLMGVKETPEGIQFEDHRYQPKDFSGRVGAQEYNALIRNKDRVDLEYETRITDEVRVMIEKLLGEGVSKKEIARRLDIPQSRVYAVETQWRAKVDSRPND